MKKIAITILSAVCLFMACSKDDDGTPTKEEYASRILGTWQLQSKMFCEKCDTNTFYTFTQDSVIESSKCELLHCDCEYCHGRNLAYDEPWAMNWSIDNYFVVDIDNIYLLIYGTLGPNDTFTEIDLREGKIITITDKIMQLETYQYLWEENEEWGIMNYRKVNDN